MPTFVPVVYSGGAPVLSSGGTQRVACEHLAAWLAVYDALQVARGRGHVAYYQTMGGADASAGTHTCGSAWDMAWTGNAAILDAREMGAAAWPRLHRLGWVGGEHVHGLIRCGDNACNGYQFAAYLLGYNGLGQNGYGAGDPLPQPTTRRTWREGIVWARAEIARLNEPAPQEDDMPIFMRTTDTSIWLLKPGAPPLGLTGEQWSLWARLGATLQGGDFNRQQVNMVSAMMQPTPSVAPAPVVDAVALAVALGPLMPTSAAIDYTAIADALGDMFADMFANRRMEN